MNESRTMFHISQKSFVKKVFFVTLLFCLYQENVATEECDFIRCIVGVKNFIFDVKVEISPFSCKKLTDIPECSESCMQKYFPNLIAQKNSNQPTFTQFCTENFSKRLDVKWPCIFKHAFRLLTCFANVSTITTNSVIDDVIHTETCRKFVEFQNCPSEVLLDNCGEESVNAVSDMLLFVLNHFKPACKGVDMNELLYIPIHYHLENNLMQVARGFDNNFMGVTECFQQLLQDDTDLKEFLCGSYDPLSDCIQFSLTRQDKAPPAVRRLVLNLFSLADMKCRIDGPEPKHLSTLTYQKSLKPFSENDKSFSLNHFTGSPEYTRQKSRLPHTTAAGEVVKNDKASDFFKSSSKSGIEKNITFHLKSTDALTVTSLFNKTVKEPTEDNFHQDSSMDDTSSDVNNKETQPTSSRKDVSSDVNKNEEQLNGVSEQHDNINYFKASGGDKVFVSRTLLLIIFILYVFR